MPQMIYHLAIIFLIGGGVINEEQLIDPAIAFFYFSGKTGGI
jgi:hypothetical protein